MKTRIFLLLSVFLLAPVMAIAQTATNPTTASAPYQYKRQGVFDCNPSGAYAQSIGALGATGGVYVPVADATVELNTGILVFKECILREVVDKERESATSGFENAIVNAIQTGRDGNPQYVVSPGDELLVVSDKERIQSMQNAKSAINPALQGSVTTASVRSYYSNTRNTYSALNCPYKGDLNAANSGRTNDVFNVLVGATGNPACNALGAYNIAEDIHNARVAQAMSYQQMQWQWGRGFYPKIAYNADPFGERVLTPASVIQESFQQVLGSGYRQLESANDVGQMVGALFAGINTQIVSSSRGLTGITQSVAGQQSYLSQVASESAAGLRDAAANAVLQQLVSSRQIEADYYKAVNAIGDILRQTIGQLRSAETQCWSLVVPKVQDYAAQQSLTLKVATSSSASQAIINTQIVPLATTTIQNINASNQALQALNQLIAGVTNTTSLDAQRIALEQYDALVAQRSLHTPQDLSAIQQQQQAVKDAMATLVQDTLKAWGDSTDPTIGWCNVNNPPTIQMWAQKWNK